MSVRLSLVVCSLGLLFPAIARGQAADVIEPMQGRDIRCTIKQTTPQGIQYEINDQSQEINILNIKGVKFANEPSEFARARNRIQSGQFDDALTELQKVNSSSLNDLAKAEFAYLNARAEAMKATRDGTLPLRDAATSVNKFLQTHPNSFHFYEMSELFGWMAFHSGEFAAAERSFQTLASSDIPPIALAGELGLARGAIEQSNWDAANTKLDAIVASAANDDRSAETKLIAKALSARVMAEKGAVAPAIAQLEEMIKSESDDRTRVFAHLYNSLGYCHLKADDTKNAVMAFLHTDLLYANEADAHAEALYYLGQLWAKINETDRSNRAKQALAQQYRNSLWAAKK
jgi:tetratricopeptide (TPR) repeat protein